MSTIQLNKPRFVYAKTSLAELVSGGVSETARPYGGASIGINVKRSRGAKGSETDETSPTREAVCGKSARTV